MALLQISRVLSHWVMRRLVGRYHTLITVIALAITALSIGVMATRWNMNSSLDALLPEDSPAAVAMRAVSERVGSGSSLFVVIDSPDQQASLRFAKAYSERLLQEPGVAMAHYHNDKSFFEKNKLLYVSERDLSTLYNEARAVIRERKKQANPLFVSLGPPKTSAAEKKKERQRRLDFEAMQEKYAAQMAHRDYNEYLFSEDGYSLVIIVRFAESSLDMVATNTLIDRVRELVEEINPERYHEQMGVEFGGGLASRQRQYNAILEDIKSSGLFTLLGLLLVLVLYFRRLRAVLVVIAPLCMGVSWTLALAFLLYGELNAITVFIFAILLGLGIDFSLHMLHGFDRARARGLERVEALQACAESTGTATLLGATTTFATFLVLTQAEFKSLSQFGVVASLGVVLTMVATVVVMPALILTFDRIKPLKPAVQDERAERARQARWNAVIGRWVRRLAPWSLLITLSATIWASHGARKLRFEEDFYRIGTFYWPWEQRPDRELQERTEETLIKARDAARALHHRAVEIRREIEPESFERERPKSLSTGAKFSSAMQNKVGSVPTILLFDDAERARQTAYRAREALSERDYVALGSLSSIYDFMPGTPTEQQARMVHIRALKELLDNEPRSMLKPEERERFDQIREGLDVEPVELEDLPDWTKRFFREAGPEAKAPRPGEPFAYEYMIVAYARQKSLNGPAARRFLRVIDEVAGDPDRMGYLLASQSYVYTTMLEQIQVDGLRMILIALIAVMCLLALAYKSPVKGLLAMTPLAIGAVWTFGACHALGIRLDFFNIIILPALIGIGVDDGIHFTRRYFELGQGSLGEVMRDVGSAVTMTSVTSLIGFGGLVVTDYDGLRSIGLLAILGITFAWLATLLVLPALLWAREELLKSSLFS